MDNVVIGIVKGTGEKGNEGRGPGHLGMKSIAPTKKVAREAEILMSQENPEDGRHPFGGTGPPPVLSISHRCNIKPCKVYTTTGEVLVTMLMLEPYGLLVGINCDLILRTLILLNILDSFTRH